MSTNPSTLSEVRSVLLVEDEPRLRELLLRAIPDMGFVAEGVGHAEEALRLMAEQPRAIVILDLNLPGMGGMELLEVIRKRWPATAVIILTAFGDLAAAKRAIRLEVVDFLTKPCHLGELEHALDRALRKSQGQAKADAAGEKDDLYRRAYLPVGGPDQQQDAPTLDELERVHILSTLERHDGNRAATATALGISLRTLYYRLAEYQKQDLLKE